MDRDKLHFEVELRPTASYIAGNPTRRANVPLTRQYEGESHARLPFWTNIHGGLIQENWDALLASVLFVMATRPGVSAEDIAKAHKGKLWAWEIEMMLEWAEQTGSAVRLEGGEAAWTTGEWWWMAFGSH